MNKTIAQNTEKTNEMLHDDAAIIVLYEKILAGEIKRFPKFTWDLPHGLYYAKVITRYLFEHKLNWSIEDIKENFNQNLVKKYRLSGVVLTLFNDNQSELIENAYPGQIKPWEYKRSTRGTWKTQEKREEALRWLFEQKLNWDIEDIKEKLTQKTFKENGFMGCFKFYNESPYEVVNAIYPNQIQPWELNKVASAYWKENNNKIKAIKWLIEVKMNWDIENVKKNLSRKVFLENGLGGLLVMHNNSPYELFNLAYPHILHPWELQQVGPSFWGNDGNKRKALKWLFEEKLGWSVDKINHTPPKEIRRAILENHLSGLASNHFQDGAYAIVKFLYPEEEFDVLKTTVKNNCSIR